MKKSFFDFFAVPSGLSKPPSTFEEFSRIIRKGRGQSLIMAAVFMLVATTLITVGMKLVANANRQSKESDIYVGEAQHAARAGIEDALGWYIRKGTLVAAYANAPKPGAVPTWGVNSQATPYTYVDQPFQPVNNTTNAQYSDTLVPSIGIVNEYPIDAPDNTRAVFFGRYEVAKISSAAATMTPAPTANANAVHDISGNRVAGQVNGNGLVWQVESTGYVYKRLDKGWNTNTGYWNVNYNTSPNTVIASAKMTSEFRKLSFNYPASQAGLAALYVANQSQVTLGSDNCLLYGAVSTTGTYPLMSFANAVTSNLVLPTTQVTPHSFSHSSCPCTVIQNPSCPCYTLNCSPTGYDSVNYQNNPGICLGGNASYSVTMLSDVAVFGMSLPDIQLIANYSGNSAVSLVLPNSNCVTCSAVNNVLIYYSGNVTFGANQPAPYQELNASGILIVNGNLTLDSGGIDTNGVQWPDSQFGGIVFVTGDLIVLGQSTLAGCVIMGTSSSYTTSTSQSVSLDGVGGNKGTISLNPALVTQAIENVAQYREDISARKTLLAIPGT
jgi:hypothetical protein